MSNEYPDIFGEEYVRILNEVSDLNQKFNFGKDERPVEVEQYRQKLWDRMRQIVVEYDQAHPLDPCPVCGGERKVSLAGVCLNIGKCRLAPVGIGG